jgi:erythromycin esterase
MTRDVGATYNESGAADYFNSVITPQSFDALLFVERTTAARPLSRRERAWFEGQAVPRNLDFEESEAGERPAGWFVSEAVGRHGFDIVTTDERPHSGKRSVVIRRVSGDYHGELVGSFVQRLDATPYRGKKIRLRAAARADLSGSDNRAWLRLAVASNDFGPPDEGFDKYAITSPEWNTYEISADVPQDAVTISYGVFMTGVGYAWLDSVSVDVLDQ